MVWADQVDTVRLYLANYKHLSLLDVLLPSSCDHTCDLLNGLQWREPMRLMIASYNLTPCLFDNYWPYLLSFRLRIDDLVLLVDRHLIIHHNELILAIHQKPHTIEMAVVQLSCDQNPFN